MRTLGDLVQRTSDTLEGMVADLRTRGVCRLPATRALARQLDVSQPTMIKALAELRARGAVTGGGRRRLRVAGLRRGPGELGQGARRARWAEVRDALARDILTGKHPAGSPLPSTRALRRSHGTSLPTMRRALDALLREGLIDRRGSLLHVPSLRAVDQAHSAVLLLAPASWEQRIEAVSPFEEEFLRVLQVQCRLSNLNLINVCYAFGSGGDVRFTREGGGRFAPATASRALLGAVVWTAGEEHRFAALMLRMEAWSMPVAVLDETGILSMPSRLPTGCRVYNVSWTATASRMVARYLLELGHRKFAYVSPFHRSVWSRNRLAGLCSVTEAAGLADAVCRSTDDRFIHLHDLYRSREGWTKESEAAFLRTQTPNRFDPAVGHLNALKEMALEHDMAEALEAHVVPLLRPLAEDGGATAWVADSDRTAVIALDYLASRGVRVPQQVSVVGFDNSLLGQRRNLTSVDFSVGAYVNAMLRHLLDRPPVNRREQPPVEIGGVIVERGSTASPAPGRRVAPNQPDQTGSAAIGET